MTSLQPRAWRALLHARQGRGGATSRPRVPTFPNVAQCQGPKCGPGLYVLALHGLNAPDRLFSSARHSVAPSLRPSP